MVCMKWFAWVMRTQCEIPTRPIECYLVVGNIEFIACGSCHIHEIHRVVSRFYKHRIHYMGMMWFTRNSSKSLQSLRNIEVIPWKYSCWHEKYRVSASRKDLSKASSVFDVNAQRYDAYGSFFMFWVHGRRLFTSEEIQWFRWTHLELRDPTVSALNPFTKSPQSVIRYPDIIYARLSDRNDTFPQLNSFNNFFTYKQSIAISSCCAIRTRLKVLEGCPAGNRKLSSNIIVHANI